MNTNINTTWGTNVTILPTPPIKKIVPLLSPDIYTASQDNYYAATAIRQGEQLTTRTSSAKPLTREERPIVIRDWEKFSIDNNPFTGDDFIASSDFSLLDYLEIRKKGYFDYRGFKFSKADKARDSHQYQCYTQMSNQNPTKWIYFLSILGYGGFLGMIPTTLILFIIGAFKWSDWEAWKIGFMFIGGCYLSYRLFGWLGSLMPDGKYISLDRRNGLLIIPSAGQTPDDPILFSEMDPYITYSITPAGTRKIFLYYLHRYSNSCCSLGGGNCFADAYLFSAYFRQFTDVTQPLPDVPELEPYRHLDPTTLVYDKKNNRPERYWRDMSKEDIQKIVTDKKNNIKKILGKDCFL